MRTIDGRRAADRPPELLETLLAAAGTSVASILQKTVACQKRANANE